MDGLARGKIIYGDSSGNPAALAVGGANRVLTSDGTDISWAAAAGGGGKVLQVVDTAYGTEQSGNSDTYSDTGLSQAITPANTANKILVLVSQNIQVGDPGGRASCSLRLVRGSTEVEEWPTAAYPIQEGGGQWFYSYLDSPSSTSSTTYHTEYKRNGGDEASIYLQRNQNGQSVSRITLIELDYS